MRGLIALGEYAFREFIPYIYKLRVEEIPDSLWPDLAPAAIFLGGHDDVYLYEWLEYGCGAALQPSWSTMRVRNTHVFHEKRLSN